MTEPREKRMVNDTKYSKIQLFLKKRKKDYAFKTVTSSVISFAVTVLFALYNGLLGVRLSSVWHGSICVFYLLLVAVRGTILLTEKKNITRSEQEKTYHRRKTAVISSVMLLMLNLALILPISLMVILEKPVNMGTIPSIAFATYTTYIITMASLHIRKQKHKNNNILVSELRAINFIDAMVSVLTLQNTLITVNQAESDGDMFILSAVSSAVIYIVIVLTSVLLLIKGLMRGEISAKQ